jgi:hypothetical protein
MSSHEDDCVIVEVLPPRHLRVYQCITISDDEMEVIPEDTANTAAEARRHEDALRLWHSHAEAVRELGFENLEGWQVVGEQQRPPRGSAFASLFCTKKNSINSTNGWAPTSDNGEIDIMLDDVVNTVSPRVRCFWEPPVVHAVALITRCYGPNLRADDLRCFWKVSHIRILGSTSLRDLYAYAHSPPGHTMMYGEYHDITGVGKFRRREVLLNMLGHMLKHKTLVWVKHQKTADFLVSEERQDHGHYITVQ